MNENSQRSRVFLICRLRDRSLKLSLPTNEMSETWTFGPASMWNVSWTTRGPPARGVISWVTSANWKPFSDHISRSRPSVRRITPGPMRLSRRSSMPTDSIAWSISARSYSSDPSKATIRTRSRSSIRNSARRPWTPLGYGSSTISMVRSVRNPVSHNRWKSPSRTCSMVSSYGVHLPCEGRLT